MLGNLLTVPWKQSHSEWLNSQHPTGHYRRHEFRLRLNEYTKAASPPRPANIAVEGSGTAEGTVNMLLMPYKWGTSVVIGGPNAIQEELALDEVPVNA